MAKEPALKNFNKTDYRVYSVRSVLFRIKYQRKRCPKMYYTYLIRKKFVTKSGRLTELGCALAVRHKNYFDNLGAKDKKREEKLPDERESGEPKSE